MTVSDKQKMSYLLQAQKQYRYGRGKQGAEGAIKRLGKAEKLAEKFVTTKLQQVSQPVQDPLQSFVSRSRKFHQKIIYQGFKNLLNT